MELQDYLRIVRRHWLAIGAIALLCAALAYGYSSTRTKVYAASSTGYVSTGPSTDPALNAVNDSLAKSRATSYVTLAKGRATAQEVIATLGLRTDPDALAGQITVTQPTDTILIDITARSTSPQQAQALADAWVTALADQVDKIESDGKTPTNGTPRVTPVASAELPHSPVSPQPKRDTGLGLIAGVLLGLGYAILRHTLDRRMRRPADIQERFHVPVVASVPASATLKHEPGSRAGLATSDFAGAPAAEAFRKLRTNLTYMSIDQPPRSLVITSARQGDGKSTIAVNVAAALADEEQPVVLIDADLRRPSVGAALGLDEVAGLTSVLAGKISLEEALQEPTGLPHLRVLTSGPSAPNPTELLGSKVMRRLIAEISQRALVIIDAPPLLPVTDAALLSTSTDGVLLVVSSGRTLDTEVETCLEAITQVNGTVLGVVLNRVNMRDNPASYYGYYRYDEQPKRRARADRRPAVLEGTPD